MRVDFIPIKEEHLELIRAWRNSEEVKKYMYTEDHISVERQREWYKDISTREDERHWLISCNETLVGIVNLKRIDLKNGSAEWAFYLGDISARNKGIGPLVEFKVLEYAFDVLKLHKLGCAVLGFNEKVIELHKKFGFVDEGRIRQQIKKNGKYVDIVLLGILSDEWEIRRKNMSKVIARLARDEAGNKG